MKKRVKFLCLACLFVSVAACGTPMPSLQSSNLNTSQTTNAPSASHEPKPPLEEVIPSYLKEGVAHRSRYTNYLYGYSIPIPKGFVAYNSPPPASNHGVGIALSDEPASYLYVDGSYNSSFYESLDEAADVRLKWLREDYPDAQLLSREPTRLSKLPAVRFTAKYNRKGVSRIEDCVIGFREVEGEIGVVYTASVDTTEERYSEDVAKLEEIVDGWRLRKTE